MSRKFFTKANPASNGEAPSRQLSHLPKWAKVEYDGYLFSLSSRIGKKPLRMMGESRLLNGERPQMQPFRVLEHTADVGFEAFGATREEVFANSAHALTYLMVEYESILPREELPLRSAGSDMPSLLVNWLSEVLYLFDAESWLLRDFAVYDLTNHSLVGTARGEKFDRKRHQIKLLVKAITYHQLDLRETGQGWRAQVYVDI